MEIISPIAGMNRSTAFQSQPPYTFYDAQNFVAQSPGKGRHRGGSRPGFSLYAPTAGSTPVRLLERVVVKTNDKFDLWTESFKSTSMAHYTTIPNLANTSLPSVSDGRIYTSYSASGNKSFVIPPIPGIDVASSLRLGAYILKVTSDPRTRVRLYFDMPTGGDFNNCYYVEFTYQSNGGWQVLSSKVTTGTTASLGIGAAASGTDSGGAREGWFEIEVTADVLKAYWRGTLLFTHTLSAGAISRSVLGVQLYASSSASTDVYVDRVRVQYHKTGNFDRQRPRLIYSQAGTLYYETFITQFTASATTRTLASDRRILSAVLGQLVYIADHGEPVATFTDGVISGGGTTFDSATFTDWTAVSGLNANDYGVHVTTAGASQGVFPITAVASGTLTITGGTDGTALTGRIERLPKYYNIVTDTLAIHTATASRGTVPAGCSGVLRYRGRIVYYGDPLDPNEMYFSRNNDPNDFLFSDADVGAANKLSASDEAGVVFGGIVAAAAFSDDYMLIWTSTATFRMSGDIQIGGTLDCVSPNIGCISRTAWCAGPKGNELYWLSRDGLYMTNIDCPSCDVISLSREKLPRELIDFNSDVFEIGMAYDIRNRWLHIYLTPKSFTTVPTGTRHWLFDLQTQGLFPIVLGVAAMNPTAVLSHQGADAEDDGVLIGGFGGGLNKLSWTAETDNGTAITWNVLLGPFNLWRDGDFSTLRELCGRIGATSNSVDWDLYVGMTAEDAVTAATDGSTPFAIGTFSAGSPLFDYPMMTGGAFVLKLSGTTRASIESITALLSAGGMARA